jgi:hypothetical protein
LGIDVHELFPLTASKIVAKYDYVDESGKLLSQVVRFEPKDFRQRKPDGNGGWSWNLDGVRRVPYRLPEILQAQDLLIVEGEKDVEASETLGRSATCNSGGAGKWLPEFVDYFCGKCVTIIADADDPGRRHAQVVALSLYGRVKSLKVIELPSSKDLSDWVNRGGTRQALDGLIHEAPNWNPPQVEASRIPDAVLAFIRRFVSLSDSQAIVAAIWVIHTHVFSAAEATAYLAVTSAEKQSGKTRLLEVLETVVSNPWMTGRVTPAVLMRKVDATEPALLLDESDAAFGADKEYAEALRGVLNTGHRRGGKASCCIGQGTNTCFKDFSTFCPKAIAGIGQLPDTVADRSIPIRLKRAGPRDKVERFRTRDVKGEAAALREQIGTWCQSIAAQLREARPDLPAELTDRQQDGAEPLLAIADAAGGEWPQRGRAALIELFSGEAAIDGSIRVRLLADIRNVFESKKVDRLASSDLIDALVEIESSPWAEFTHGKRLTPVGMARLLRPLEISPRSVRLSDSSTPKGYTENLFQDAWDRYLRPRAKRQIPEPTSQTQQPPQGLVFAASALSGDPPQKEDVAAAKSQESPATTGIVADVARVGAREETAPAAVLVPKRCYVHGTNTTWWQRQAAGSNGFVCGRCHPAPSVPRGPEKRSNSKLV